MRKKSAIAIISLLTLFITGECTSSNTVPEPGTVIGGVLGTVNISLYCEFINDNNITLATNWFKQTPEDRQNNRLQAIVSGNDAFIITGGILFSDGLEIPQQSNLTILSLTEDLDDVIIYCGVADGEIDFTLRIYYPPVLLDQGEVVIRENEELSLDMRDPDSPPAFPFPSQYMWTRQNDSMENRVFNYSSIFIGSVEPSDAGTYTLTATNYELDGVTLLGTDSASITLSVLFGAGLTIPVGSENVTVLEGDSVTLVCGTNLTGNPIPTITWTDNDGSEVFQGDRYILSSGRDIVSLTLNSSVRGDTGEWTCSAQVYEDSVTGMKEMGEPVERTLQLVVVALSPPDDVAVHQSSTTWIELRWSQTEIPIIYYYVISVVKIKGVEEKNITVDGGLTTANVTDLLPATQYMFTIVTVSMIGNDKVISPSSVPVTNTTASSAPGVVCVEAPVVEDIHLMIEWSYIFNGGFNITSTQVEYKDDISDTFMTLNSYTSGSGSIQFSGSGDVLQSETTAFLPLPTAGITYTFKVTATNKIGSAIAYCPSIFLTTGIPSVPNVPYLISSSDNIASVELSTNYSGVHDPTVDDFTFILHIVNFTNNDSVVKDVEIPVMWCPEGGGNCSVTYNVFLTTHFYNVSVSASNRYGLSEVSDFLTLEMTTEEQPNDILVIIIASVGGVVIMSIAVILLVIACCILRGRETINDNTCENNNRHVLKRDTILISNPRQPFTPTIMEPQLHFGEALVEIPGLQTSNTFNTEQHLTTFTVDNAATSSSGEHEMTDAPVNHTNEVMTEELDDDYEELVAPLPPRYLPVPHPVPLPCDTFDNTAYNAVDLGSLTYYSESRCV